MKLKMNFRYGFSEEFSKSTGYVEDKRQFKGKG